MQLLRGVRIGKHRVEIDGVPGWLLYQPADGRVVVPEAPQSGDAETAPERLAAVSGLAGLASLLARDDVGSQRGVPQVRSFRSGVRRRRWI